MPWGELKMLSPRHYEKLGAKMGMLEAMVIAFIKLIRPENLFFVSLGTIVGLIISFKAVGDPKIAAAGGGSTALAAGISVAMFTTMWGLIVAIPSIFFYTVVSNKTQNILDDIDEHSVKLIHLLTGGK